MNLKKAIGRFLHPDFFFIQIGANDGVAFDPIHKWIMKYHWRGIVVEPLDYLMEKVKENRKKNKGLIYEQCAITDHAGTEKMYRIDTSRKLPENIKGYANANASLSREAWLVKKRDSKLVKHFKEEILPHMIEFDVQCITFSDLVEKNSVKGVDLLQIDAEGEDYKIIKSIDFSKTRPDIIHYENMNLTDNDKLECLKHLELNGYRCHSCRSDTLAIVGDSNGAS